MAHFRETAFSPETMKDSVPSGQAVPQSQPPAPCGDRQILCASADKVTRLPPCWFGFRLSWSEPARADISGSSRPQDDREYPDGTLGRNPLAQKERLARHSQRPRPLSPSWVRTDQARRGPPGACTQGGPLTFLLTPPHPVCSEHSNSVLLGASWEVPATHLRPPGPS